MLNERWLEPFLTNFHPMIPMIWSCEQRLRLCINLLKIKVQDNQRRRQEAAEKYGVGIDYRNELNVRLELLINMFIGVHLPERYHFELQWQDTLTASLEDGIAKAQEMKRAERRSKNLHLPNGKVLKIDPGED